MRWYGAALGFTLLLLLLSRTSRCARSIPRVTWEELQALNADAGLLKHERSSTTHDFGMNQLLAARCHFRFGWQFGHFWAGANLLEMTKAKA